MIWNIKLKLQRCSLEFLYETPKYKSYEETKIIKIQLKFEKQCNLKNIPSFICKNLQVCSIVRNLQHWCGTQQQHIPFVVPSSH
jgi:hypothetical protein